MSHCHPVTVYICFFPAYNLFLFSGDNWLVRDLQLAANKSLNDTAHDDFAGKYRIRMHKSSVFYGSRP